MQQAEELLTAERHSECVSKNMTNIARGMDNTIPSPESSGERKPYRPFLSPKSGESLSNLDGTEGIKNLAFQIQTHLF